MTRDYSVSKFARMKPLDIYKETRGQLFLATKSGVFNETQDISSHPCGDEIRYFKQKHRSHPEVSTFVSVTLDIFWGQFTVVSVATRHRHF